MTIPQWISSPRLTPSAMFAVVIVVFVLAQWHLLKTTESVLPTAQYRDLDNRRHTPRGVDRSFLVDVKKKHEQQNIRSKFIQEFAARERQEKAKALARGQVKKPKEEEQPFENEKGNPNETVKNGGSDEENGQPNNKPQQSTPSKSIKPMVYSNNAFREDELCGGCRSLKMDNLMRGIHREICGIIIYNKAKEENWSLVYATRYLVHKMNHTDCLPCLKCEPKSKQYWRYDLAAPKIANAKTYYFQSLPAENHRIPTEVLDHPNMNMTRYFADLNQRGDPPKPYLFEYNPTIVPMPKYMTFDGLPDADQIAYVASFRLATTQACFDTETTLQLIGGEWESEQRPQKKDYLAIALMRQDLSVVTEAIVDLPRPFRKREDFRLFVLQGQLFLATYCKLTPLWIMTRADAPDFEAKLQWDLTTTVHSWEAIKVFDSPIRVKIGSDITQCAEEKIDNMHSKNLNYFVNSKEQIMVEMFPLDPHTIRHLPHAKDPEAATPTRADDITTEEMPIPSFYTLEELVLANEMDFFEHPFTQDRGGACCIEIHHPITQKPLWLGIAHAKTPHARKKLEGRLISNQYVSRFYAFETEHPYKLVAVSGFFCLPHPSGSGGDNPLAAHSAPEKVWSLGSVTLNCPVIHFVTGMTEKVEDPETLILAYGVADCTPWFAEVKKADVVQMLFFGPDAGVESRKART
jgi:hypothetical protein